MSLCMCMSWSDLLQRYVSVLLGDHLFPLPVQGEKPPYQASPSLLWLNHVIHPAMPSGCVGIPKFRLVLLHQALKLCLGVIRVLEVPAMYDSDSPLGAHHSKLPTRPSQIDIGPKILARHCQIRTAVRLPCHHSQLGDSGLCVCIEQLSAMPNYAAPFLDRARQEAGDVNKGDQG